VAGAVVTGAVVAARVVAGAVVAARVVATGAVVAARVVATGAAVVLAAGDGVGETGVALLPAVSPQPVITRMDSKHAITSILKLAKGFFMVD
jgi:hypothetical protein